MIASQDATYRGVAYGVDKLVNGDLPFQLGITEDGIPGAIDPIESNNESFGGPAISETQGQGDDALTHIFGMGSAFGAGNDNVDGSPTVGNIGRNTMSVAAYNDLNTTAPTDDVVLGISSRGPSPGGRKEPDLSAPGAAIVGPDINWQTGPDFTAETGTSFSSPHVAGAMALLEGAGIGSPIAQRALLINSARDWNGSTTSATSPFGWTAPQTGWRPEVGWGALDLTTALAQRGNYQLDSVPEGEAAFYRATMPAGGKTTMAFEQRSIWPDFPANGSSPALFTQSNLDLRQYTATGAEIPPPAAFDPPNTTIDPGPDAVDPNDTVEQTRTPSAQAITFKVEAASEVDGVEAEPFAISSAAALTELAPPVTRPTGASLSSSATVACGQDVTVTTQLVNDSGDLDSTSSAVGLELPAGVELVSGLQTQTVSGGTLEAGTTSETPSWTVEATADGPHVLTIAGQGQGLGTPFRREAELTLTSDCVSPDTALGSGPGGSTNDPTPSFAFSASGGASGFDCRIDDGAFSACSSPFTTPSLPDGAHRFEVRARDAVGNLDGSPASRSFTVDTVVSGAKLSGRKHQRYRGELAVDVKTGLGEQGSVRLSAKLSGPRLRGKARSVRLDLPAGGSREATLEASRSVDRKVAAALERGKVKVRVRARFADEPGNTARLERTTTLRRP